MYQFYYADSSRPLNRQPCKENIRDRFHITAVRPAMWEEHCLECSAPACFESCVHYEARSDGRCRRFVNGLQTFPEEKAACGQGVRVVFRKWANMMTVLFPAMVTEEEYQKLWKKNEGLGKVLSLVEASPLPRSLRWQGIRIPEYLRRRSLRGLSGLENRADAFLFHGYSYHSEPFRLILEVFDDHTPLYKTAVALCPGENLAVLQNLPEECSRPGNLVKIYPENDVEAELDILWCDFVQGTAVPAETPAPKVKCLVWDLDNTMWEGTLLEAEDPMALQLKPGVRETLRALDERGILHSVASKNDHDAAWAVLEHLGVAEYFLYPQIHWQPKSGSLEQIAKDLNIGIDALAFVDDTAFERHEVSARWPQVRTYDAVETEDLPNREELQVNVTAESRVRRELYRAEAHRNARRAQSGAGIEDFLRACHLRVQIFSPQTPEETLRSFELVVRTNQLNMTGVKYTPEEFETVCAREGHRNFAFSCADDFGDYGIVGFGQYRMQGQELCMTEFAMSCRVAGKYVESALFAALLEGENCTCGSFTVQKTRKNILLRNTLEQIGFVPREDSDSTVSYGFSAGLKNRDIVHTESRL